MYLKVGVKQGCNLSPVLFNIFLLDVVNKIDNLKLGISIGGEIVTIIVFADDIVILLKNFSDMKTVMDILDIECKQRKMEISKKKSKIMRIGNPLRNSMDIVTLDQVLEFKYLGVKLNNKPQIYFGDFAQNCLNRSTTYKGSIMSKSKSSHDPVVVAQQLWTKVAVPAILYGSEVIPLRKTELRQLNSDAATVGKFILQLPQNTTNVTSFLVTGIRSMTYEYYKRVIQYHEKLQEKEESELVKKALRETEKLKNKSGYTRLIEEMKEELKEFRNLEEWYSNTVNMERDSNKSSCWLLPKFGTGEETMRLKYHGWGEDGKTYAEFITMNTGLGNRAPMLGHPQYKNCKLCETRNQQVKINEIHMLLECPWLDEPRKEFGIKEFIQKQGLHEMMEIYRRFWIPQQLNPDIMKKRIKAATNLRQIYWEVVEEISQ